MTNVDTMRSFWMVFGRLCLNLIFLSVYFQKGTFTKRLPIANMRRLRASLLGATLFIVFILIEGK